MKKILAVLAVVLAFAVVSFAAPGVPSFVNAPEHVSGDVTNGQAIALSAPVMVLNSIGQVSGETNTVTITAPHYVDEYILVTVASGSTNLVLIADDGVNLSLGADVLLGPTDTLLLRPVASNKVVKVSTSDN